MSLPNKKYTSKLLAKHILVFGGTSGIGFSVAEAAIEHGAIVTISGSNQVRLDKALERLRKAYPNTPADNIRGYVCDLADSANVESNLHTLLNRTSDGGKFNHIAFTAGNHINSLPLKDLTLEVFNSLGSVRLVAVLMLAKILAKYMDLTADNSLTITSGIGPDKPISGLIGMTVWGGALYAAVRGLAVELAPLRVNLISLGTVQTELLESFGPPNVLEAFKEATLVKELGRPEDVAEAYIYAMKDRFLTGTIIRSEGGRLLVN